MFERDINEILGSDYFIWAANEGWSRQDIIDGHKERLDAYIEDLEQLGFLITPPSIEYENIFTINGENVIVAGLHEGMGNQMFQAATSFALAKDRNVDFYVFQSKGLEHQASSSAQPEPLRNLPFLENKVPIPHADVWGRTAKDLKKIFPADQNESWLINGHLQTPQVFEPYREDILDLFGPTDETVSTLKSRYPELNNSNTIGIHVRRGDYVTLELNNKKCFHNLLDEWTYYEQALQKLDPKGNATVFVMSDDIEYCKSQEPFKSLKNIIFVDGNESAAEDLYTMTLCKDQIISNGTFAWWGAYLGTDENKRVCYPSKWLGPGYGDSLPKDLALDAWTQIQCKKK